MNNDSNLPPVLPHCIRCQASVAPDDAVVIGGEMVCAACKPFVLQQLREGVAPKQTLPLAGIGIRFLAFFIDGVIGYTLGLLIGLLSGQSLAEASGFDGSSEFTRLDGLLLVISIALDLTYATLMLTRYGGTLGKLFTGLRVVREDGTGLSWQRALSRTLAGYLSFLTCLIGYVIAVFDPERRALHDHICRTRVVRARRNSAGVAA